MCANHDAHHSGDTPRSLVRLSEGEHREGLLHVMANHGRRSIKLGRRVVDRECDVVAWIEEQVDVG